MALTLEHYNLLGPVYDSRVSPVPDARTIRYYTTLGLLDRPWMEGRQARYGKRHLLQVVSIKALQGRGLPLSEVQARLYGMSNEHLEGLLTTLSESAHSVRKTEPLRPIVWKEVIVEPGLKLMIEEGWVPSKNPLEMEKRISALLRALSPLEDSNGGTV